ncbi:MAG: hypothetical protein EA407_14990 [Rhodobacteraceae bacterium]|nr:MAG: hypothetical protein EA407_14990 [Paracoccaceae bacterium]
MVDNHNATPLTIPMNLIGRAIPQVLMRSTGELVAGKLHPLIGVEDFRDAMTAQGIIQTVDAKPRIQGVGV